jgi:hypothetical protein
MAFLEHNVLKLFEKGEGMITLHYEKGRFFFDPFNSANDVNPKTKRAGIASYQTSGWRKLLYHLARIFHRVVTYQDQTGRVHYLNKESLRKWSHRHGEDLPLFDHRIINVTVELIINKMSAHEIKGVNTQRMSREQIHTIFNLNPALLENLTPEQLRAIVQHLTPEAMIFLKQEQIKDLNLRPLNQKQLRSLFDRFIRNLSVSQLHSVVQHLSWKDFRALSEKQIQDLIPLLTDEELKNNYEKFTEEMFEELSDRQFQSMVSYLNPSELSSDHLWGLLAKEARLNVLSTAQLEAFFRYFHIRAFSSLSQDDRSAIGEYIQEEVLKKIIDQQLKDLKTDDIPDPFKQWIEAEKKLRGIGCAS